MNFGNFVIGDDHPPFIIAEVSANHGGNFQTALDTILEAKRCGAHAVKIQSYTADTMTLPLSGKDFEVKLDMWKGRNLYELYKEAETPYEWHQEMFNFARSNDILLFSTPFDETAVELLESLEVPGYKLASFELTDIPLIERLARTNKPVIFSTGMATLEEIDEAISAFSNLSSAEFSILHCISGYPTPTEDMNLSVIGSLSERYGVPIGLSDHSLDNTAAIASVALGSKIIEKHFVLNNNSKAADAEFSLNPEGLEELVKKTYSAWLSLGDGEKEISDQELSSRRYRRSLYIASDLKAGHIVGEEDIIRRRPAIGIEPKYIKDIIGKTVREHVKYGTPVTWDLFTDEK